MTLEFSEEQINYLSQLTKFSGRTNKIEVIRAYDNPKMKLNFIRQNFNNLSVEEQVEFNDEIFKMKRFALMIGSSIYKILVTPATKTLSKPLFKCLLGSTFFAFAYYKYNQKLHYEWLQLRFAEIKVKNK